MAKANTDTRPLWDSTTLVSVASAIWLITGVWHAASEISLAAAFIAFASKAFIASASTNLTGLPPPMLIIVGLWTIGLSTSYQHGFENHCSSQTQRRPPSEPALLSITIFPLLGDKLLYSSLLSTGLAGRWSLIAELGLWMKLG